MFRAVVIVEKDAVFQRLVDEGFSETANCVLVTGKGMPDHATRCFVSELSSQFPNLHIVGGEKISIVSFEDDPHFHSVFIPYESRCANLLHTMLLKSLAWGLWNSVPDSKAQEILQMKLLSFWNFPREFWLCKYRDLGEHVACSGRLESQWCVHPENIQVWEQCLASVPKMGIALPHMAWSTCRRIKWAARGMLSGTFITWQVFQSWFLTCLIHSIVSALAEATIIAFQLSQLIFAFVLSALVPTQILQIYRQIFVLKSSNASLISWWREMQDILHLACLLIPIIMPCACIDIKGNCIRVASKVPFSNHWKLQHQDERQCMKSILFIKPLKSDVQGIKLHVGPS